MSNKAVKWSQRTLNVNCLFHLYLSLLSFFPERLIFLFLQCCLQIANLHRKSFEGKSNDLLRLPLPSHCQSSDCHLLNACNEKQGFANISISLIAQGKIKSGGFIRVLFNEWISVQANCTLRLVKALLIFWINMSLSVSVGESATVKQYYPEQTPWLFQTWNVILLFLRVEAIRESFNLTLLVGTQSNSNAPMSNIWLDLWFKTKLKPNWYVFSFSASKLITVFDLRTIKVNHFAPQYFQQRKHRTLCTVQMPDSLLKNKFDCCVLNMNQTKKKIDEVSRPVWASQCSSLASLGEWAKTAI